MKLLRWITSTFSFQKSCEHIVENAAEFGKDYKNRYNAVKCIKCNQVILCNYYVPRKLDNNSDL